MNENRENWVLPQGFVAGGIYCGIKKSGKLDLGVIISTPPALAFGSYTTNPFCAPSIDYCRKITESGQKVSHVLVNSGNANACTGERGSKDTLEIAERVKASFGEVKEVLLSSTGIIGEYLPMPTLKKGVEELAHQLKNLKSKTFAEAIMTTDTRTKTTEQELSFALGKVRVAGASKGSGMICPNMATMLGYIMTDIQLEPSYLKSFQKYIKKSFNSISVDGDTSTNDTVILLSNGQSGVCYDLLSSEEQKAFDKALENHFHSLAQQIVADGEGATKLVEVRVKGCESDDQAHELGKAISNSALIKTALFGNDPNWGRVLVTLGTHSKTIKPQMLDISFCGVPVFLKGSPLRFERETLIQKMSGKKLALEVNLNMGKGEWVCWTCDFSYDYVKINAEYHT